MRVDMNGGVEKPAVQNGVETMNGQEEKRGGLTVVSIAKTIGRERETETERGIIIAHGREIESTTEIMSLVCPIVTLGPHHPHLELPDPAM
jgi:hypothetical protein